MPDWVVIADDLTGALDTAAALAGGNTAQVVLDSDKAWPAARVVAVSTRARDDDEAAVARRVGDAVARALDRDARLFLKIDSLLRGTVGASVAAALEACRAQGRRFAVVAPAFPAMGRVTRCGRVEVAGEGLLEDRDAAALLAAAGVRSRVIGRGEALHHLPTEDEPVDALIIDSESDEDLNRVAAAFVARRDVLFVGTAGLAAQLGAGTGPKGGADVAAGHRALVAIGSYAPQAHAQVAHAARAGARHLVVSQSPRASGRKARAILPTCSVLLTPDHGSRHPDPAVVAGRLAEAVAEALDAADLLVLAGGHTAQTVLDRLGVSRLECVNQLEPGVVASRMPGRPQLVVTKAGAFGDAEALLRVIDRLKGAGPERSAR